MRQSNEKLMLIPTEARVREAYKNADANGRRLLEDLHGKEFFKQKITDRIQNWSDIVSLSGSKRANDDDLTMISRAYNEGWEADFNNPNQRKYYPVFQWVPGSGLVLVDVHYTDVCTGVGARRSFETEEKCLDAVSKFLPVFKKWHS